MPTPQAPGRPAAQRSSQQQVRPRSFLIGTQNVLEGGDYDQTLTTLTGGALTPWTLQATGWLRRLWIQVDYTTTGGTAITADGPFNMFSNVELDDVNNEAIFGPFNGYVWYVINKMGGYYFWDDPATNAVYTATATAGTFVLQVPIEIVSRDPLGPVASVNNTAALTLKMTLAGATTAFTGATAWSVRVRGTQEFYWEPKKVDKQGRPISGSPPAAGTTQYWTQGSLPIAAAGTINSQLITGLGYPWRQYLFLFYDTGGTRATGETNWPDPLIGLKFEANMLVSQYTKTQWRAAMAREYGYPNATMDVRGAGSLPGKENGLYTLNFNKDFYDNHPGSETRRTYLVTSPGSNFIFNGNFGGAGTLYSIVNYCAPGGGTAARGNTAALTGGQ